MKLEARESTNDRDSSRRINEEEEHLIGMKISQIIMSCCIKIFKL